LVVGKDKSHGKTLITTIQLWLAAAILRKVVDIQQLRLAAATLRQAADMRQLLAAAILSLLPVIQLLMASAISPLVVIQLLPASATTIHRLVDIQLVAVTATPSSWQPEANPTVATSSNSSFSSSSSISSSRPSAACRNLLKLPTGRSSFDLW
jgi:hypothetical protein